VLNAEGYPCYKGWFDIGATTLWETWNLEENHDSKNHQMYSDFMSWFIKTILGIRINAEKLGEVKFLFQPQFIDDLTFAEGNYETVKGNIYVKWEKRGNNVDVIVDKAPGIELLYNGELLLDGENRFSVTL
jgi:alpha-L-rhamnosidase